MFKPLFLLFAFCFLPITPSFAHGSFVYVSNYGDGTISQFRENPSGTLTPLNPPSVKAWLRCHSLAADPTGHFLYVLSTLEFSQRNCLLSAFRIAPDGRLTPLSPHHVSLPGIPYLVTVNPTKPYLYVLNYGGSVSQFRIKKNGTLAPLWLPDAGVVSEGMFEYAAAFDPRNSVFYVTGITRMTNEYLGGISAFRADTLQGIHLALPNSGSLAVGPYAPFPPQQVLTAHQGRSVFFLYQGFASYAKSASAPAGNLEAVLTQYQARANGKLRPFVPASVQCPGNPQAAAVDPQSRSCYLFLQPQYADGYPVKTNKIIVTRYSIRANGSLGRRTQQNLTAPDGLFCPIFDPSGQTLYLLTHHGLSVFHVRRDGALAPIGSGPVSAGHGPLRMICVRR